MWARGPRSRFGPSSKEARLRADRCPSAPWPAIPVAHDAALALAKGRARLYDPAARCSARSPMRRWLAALSVYRDRRILLIFCLGFSSGLPLLLTAGTLTTWLAKEEGELGTIRAFSPPRG